MLYISITVILCFTITSRSFSQVDPQISQFWLRKIMFNPASIEKNNMINIYGLARQQWTGFENAPSTQFLGVSNYFENIRVGLGLSFVNDNIGPESAQNLKLNYSYNFRLNRETIITFGAGTGIIHRSINPNKLVFEDNNDPYKNMLTEKQTTVDFDFGFEIQYQNFIIGASCLHLLKSNQKATNFKIPRHFHAYGLYNFVINEELLIQPIASFRNTGNIWQAELATIVNYKNTLWGGLSYRFEDAFVISARVEILENFQLGYSYDMDAGPVRSFSSGSHEISLTTQISKGNAVLKSPRFFD